jgi:hypothetical protein
MARGAVPPRVMDKGELVNDVPVIVSGADDGSVADVSVRDQL